MLRIMKHRMNGLDWIFNEKLQGKKLKCDAWHNVVKNQQVIFKKCNVEQEN